MSSKRALALALEQRVGRDRGAHLHRADQAGGNRLAGGQAEEIADALHGGVAIGLRILRQQLMGNQRAVGPPPDHVGEGAAAIDPEIPIVTRRILVRLSPARCFIGLHAPDAKRVIDLLADKKAR